MRDHHFIDQHPLLADHLRGRNRPRFAPRRHRRSALRMPSRPSHRQADLDQVHVRRLHRRIRAFDQRSHRERFHDAQRFECFHFVRNRRWPGTSISCRLGITNQSMIAKLPLSDARRTAASTEATSPRTITIYLPEQMERESTIHIRRLQHGVARLIAGCDAGEFD